MISRMMSLWRRLRGTTGQREDRAGPPAPRCQAPAVPGGPEPDALHHGRHRIKEVFTHHWDLDYLSEAELRELEKQVRR